VATCGAIARALGDLRAARAVATWLVDHPDTAGAHRVVRADGRPVLPGALPQLAREGIHHVLGRVPAARIVGPLEPTNLLTRLREEQRRLAEQVVERREPGHVGRIAGVDAAYDGDATFVAAACLDAKDLAPIEVVTVRGVTDFPYIPTYLAYRESPGIEAAVRRLKHGPDVLMIDGHGRLHPALFGVACYVGVRLNLPTIGVAKHPLVGRVKTRHSRANAPSPIEFNGRVIGYAWTPPGRARPVFISVGHRISLDRALEVVRDSTRHGYPEPLRVADRICREMKGNEKREKGAMR
jgi:deoxyribonuclease V